MLKCNFCGKHFPEKDKVGSHFRRINSNNYNYLEFCCSGHLNLFIDNTEMILVNNNGLTQKEQIEQDKINAKNRLIDDEIRAKKRFKEKLELKNQRNNKYGSEDNYFDEITKKINSDKEGCFIATAVYEDYNHPIVLDLRSFRDNWILNQKWGVNFINWYYVYGSIASSYIRDSSFLKFISYCLLIKPLHIIVKFFGLHKSE